MTLHNLQQVTATSREFFTIKKGWLFGKLVIIGASLKSQRASIPK